MRWIWFGVVGFAVVGLALNATITSTTAASGEGGEPVLPRNTEAELLFAQRFSLAQPAVHRWRSEQPSYTSGWLAVVRVEREKVRISQDAVPVLYVGSETAQRINYGDESGCLVIVVPGDFELAEAPIYFGAAALPEDVTSPQVARELAAARARDVREPGEAVMLKVVQDNALYADAGEMMVAAADLIERFSPQERDLITGLRAPLVK